LLHWHVGVGVGDFSTTRGRANAGSSQKKLERTRMSDKQSLPASYDPRLPGLQGPAPLPAVDFQPPLDEGEDTSSPQLQRYVAAVLRYKWLVLVLVVAGTVAGVVVGRKAPQKYVAEATLYFSGSDAVIRGPTQTAGLLQKDAWISLVRSFTVLDAVVREQKLYLEYDRRDAEVLAGFDLDSIFVPGKYLLQVSGDGRTAELRNSTGTFTERQPVGQLVGRQLGFIWAPPAQRLPAKRTVRFTVLNPREASRKLGSTLETRMPNTSFLLLQYTGDDPVRVTSVLNAVADRYVAVAAQLKRSRVTELRNILEVQLDSAERKMNEAERELETFRVATITKPSEYATPINPGIDATRVPALSNFFQLQLQREEMQRDRQAVQRTLDRSVDALSVDALSAIASVRQSPELWQALGELTTKRAELRSLRQVFTGEHESVIRATADIRQLEGGVIPQLATLLVAELDARIAGLDGLIDSASGELREIPTRAIDEARLRRIAAMQENMYSDLRRNLESARLGAETTTPDLEILDRATPPYRPMTDTRISFALMGFGGSLALGLLLAIMMDRADPRIRYAEQLTNELRLTIIGAVPHIAGKGNIAGAVNNAEVIEAFRGVRLNLMYAYGSAGPLMVTVTSPGAGDGKTFLTSNLALAFADLGYRTLLIDGDTRRGLQHRLFDRPRRAGLTDYLMGEATIETVIQKTSFARVDLIAGGARRANAPELLQSPRMSELLAAIKPEYQVVLIDSPPLGAGVDPLLLGSLTGNIMLVMRTGTTDRRLAEAKLQILDRLPIRVLGAVLNGVQGGDGYHYYSYLPGYESRADENESPSARLLEPAGS
jgi:polysaccharide biosynthesis transport protein